MDKKFAELDKVGGEIDAVDSELNALLAEYQIFVNCEYANWVGKLTRHRLRREIHPKR